MSGSVFADTPDLELRTDGQQLNVALGDWYGAGAASTDRAHHHAVQVTQAMLDASAGGTVTITIEDAEVGRDGSGTDAADVISGRQDPTRFRLLASDRATVLDAAVVASGTAHGHAVSFAVSTAGDYFVEAVTGAQAVYASNNTDYSTETDLNNDRNAYTLRVSEEGGLLGAYQAAYAKKNTSTLDLHFIVPAGTTSLFLRNFDVENRASAIRYHDPTGTVRAGTSSGDGTWNGTSASGIAGMADTGGDVITGLGAAEAGVWRVEFVDFAPTGFIFEANTGTGPGDAQRLVVYEEAPNIAPTVDAATADQHSADGAGVSLDAAAAFDDGDGDDLGFSVTGLPAGLSIDADTGRITGIIATGASQASGGVYTVTVTADDGNGGSIDDVFSWTVTNPAPVANDDTATASEDIARNINVLGNDTDEDALTVTAASASDGTVAIEANGTLTYTPNANFNGSDTITYTVTDADGASSDAEVAVTVQAVNDTPKIHNGFGTYTAEFGGSTSRADVGKASYFADEQIAIDVGETYDLSVTAFARNIDPAERHYLGFASFDADGFAITGHSYGLYGGSARTTLAVDLVAGATEVVLDDATGWYDGGNANGSSLAWYGYTNSDGFTYADYGYTRNRAYNIWDAGAISENVITLRDPWSGPTLSAGEAVGNSYSSGGTYQYALLSRSAIPAVPTSYTVSIGGAGISDGRGSSTLFRPGTATISPLVLANYIRTETELTVSDFTIAASTGATIFTEGDLPIAIVNGNGAIADVDDTDVESLTVTLSDGKDGDVLRVNTAAITARGIGVTGDGNSLLTADGTSTVTLTGSATLADYEAAVREITFENVSQDPVTTNRTISFLVNDGDADSEADALILKVNAANDAPTIDAATPDQAAFDAATVSLDAAAAFGDLDSNDLTYTAIGLPPGLWIDAATGLITGTLDASASQPGGGVYAITVTASDGSGDSVDDSFSWTVTNPAPIASDDTATAIEDIARNINVLGNDTDEDALTVTAASALHGTVVIEANGTLTYTSNANFNGSDTITYTVTDADGAIDTAEVAVSVEAANDGPTVDIETADQTGFDGASVFLDAAAAFGDPDGDDLDFTVADVLAGLSIDANTGLISGTLGASASQIGGGVYTVTVTASDGNGGTADDTFAWTVTNPPPVANDDGGYRVDEGGTLDLPVLDNDVDPDGDVLVVASASVDPASGSVSTVGGNRIRFVAANGFNGEAVISYTASDGEGGTSDGMARVGVTPVNDAPTLLAPFGDLQSRDADALAFNASSRFADADDAVLVYSATGLPAGLSIDPLTGRISGTLAADASARGVYEVVVIATDAAGASAAGGFRWEVQNPAPVAGADTASLLRNGFVDISALENDVDPDGDPLLIASATASSGAVEVRPGGVLRFVPEAGFIGEVDLVYLLVDSQGASVTGNVRVAVRPGPPTAADDTYTLDPDGSLVRRPSEGVLANDRASNGTSAGTAAVLLTPPLRGSLTLAPDGSFDYRGGPTRGEAGGSGLPDSFRYRLTDATGLSTDARVVLRPAPRLSPALLAAAAADATLATARANRSGSPFQISIAAGAPGLESRVALPLRPGSDRDRTAPPTLGQGFGTASADSSLPRLAPVDVWAGLGGASLREPPVAFLPDENETGDRAGEAAVVGPVRVEAVGRRIRFGSGGDNVIRLADPDDRGGAVRVTVEVDRGELTLRRLPGLLIEDVNPASGPVPLSVVAEGIAADGAGREAPEGQLRVTSRAIEIVGSRRLTEAALIGLEFIGADDLDDAMQVTFERLSDGARPEPVAIRHRILLHGDPAGGAASPAQTAPSVDGQSAETLAEVRPEAGAYVLAGFGTALTFLFRRKASTDRRRRAA